MSTFTYDEYKKSCRCLGKKHTMTEKQFNEIMGIYFEIPIPPLQIKPKNQRAVQATHSNYERVENV